MKKEVYTIGRDTSCDIVLQDSSNLASRFHACLRVGKRGTYTIVDQSMNGTYVNGIRLEQGVEVPVSREDSIRFAQTELDWSCIPDNNRVNYKVILFVVLGILLGAALTFGIYTLIDKLNDSKESIEQVVNDESTDKSTDNDSTEVEAKPVKPKPKKQPKQSPAPEKKTEPVNPKTTNTEVVNAII